MDGAHVNVRTGHLLDIPYIKCYSHLLNLEVNLMTKNNMQLTNTIQSVQDTMTDIKGIIKNAAVLRNLIALAPQLYNKTCWTGKHGVLHKFLRLRDFLMEVQDDENSSFRLNRTTGFNSKVVKYE